MPLTRTEINDAVKKVKEARDLGECSLCEAPLTDAGDCTDEECIFYIKPKDKEEYRITVADFIKAIQEEVEENDLLSMDMPLSFNTADRHDLHFLSIYEDAYGQCAIDVGDGDE